MKYSLPLLGVLLFTGCQSIPLPPPITEDEIVQMSKEGTPPGEIIKKIGESLTVYSLGAKDVIRLHEEGVQDPVIDYMLTTEKWEIEQSARGRFYYYYYYPGPFGYPYQPYCGHYPFYRPWW